MTTVLITGVAGLLGSRLADWICENHPEVQVVGIDNLSGGYIENVHSKVAFVKGDVGHEDLELLFRMYHPTVVYHFAAYAAEGLSPFIRKFNYENNLVATANVINNCIKFGVQRLVFTSSMAVYGSGRPPFKESDQPRPIDPYGVAKYACEQDIQIAGEQHGLDWCILRPHNVYGAKQNIWDPYRNVLGIFMYKLLRGDPLTVFGDGQQKRAFSYIDDSLEPLWNAGFAPQASRQIINIGTQFEVTIQNAAELVIDEASLLNDEGVWQSHRPWMTPEIVHLSPRHEVKDAYCTFEKSERLLGFRDITKLWDGIRRMWLWAIVQPDRPRFIWPSYEIDTGIYPYWKPEALVGKEKVTA